MAPQEKRTGRLMSDREAVLIPLSALVPLSALLFLAPKNVAAIAALTFACIIGAWAASWRRLARLGKDGPIIPLYLAIFVAIPIGRYGGGFPIEVVPLMILPYIYVGFLGARFRSFTVSLLLTIAHFGTGYYTSSGRIQFFELIVIGSVVGELLAWARDKQSDTEAELRAHVESLAAEANIDTLTAIGNRRSFDKALEKLWPNDAVIFFDLDYFKQVNDQQGHAAGDAALVLIARCIRSLARERDVVARPGGDELAMIAHGVDRETVARIIARIREKWNESNPPTTFSVGVAIHRHFDAGAETAIRADRALYQAKAAGRNCDWFAEDSTPEQRGQDRRKYAAEFEEKPETVNG